MSVVNTPASAPARASSSSRSSPIPTAEGAPKAVIDHTAFPHLIAAILASCPRETLLTLRRTCKAMRDAADTLLAGHLVITSGTPPLLAARAGRLPVLRRRRAGVTGCESIYARARECVVDIVGAVNTYPRSPVVAKLNALGGVRVVRMRHAPGGALAPACVLKAREVVVFTTVMEREHVRRAGRDGGPDGGGGAVAVADGDEDADGDGSGDGDGVQDGDRDGDGDAAADADSTEDDDGNEEDDWATGASLPAYAPAVAATPALPACAVSRVVLNIRYDPNRPWLAQAFVAPILLPATVHEFVVIFTEKATHREPQVGGGTYRALVPGGMLHTILGMVAECAVRAILVDTERLHPAWLGLAPGMPVESGIQAALQRIADVLEAAGPRAASVYPAQRGHGQSARRSPNHTPAITGPRGTLSFMSRDEYRAHVGDEAFALETVE